MSIRLIVKLPFSKISKILQERRKISSVQNFDLFPLHRICSQDLKGKGSNRTAAGCQASKSIDPSFSLVSHRAEYSNSTRYRFVLRHFRHFWHSLHSVPRGILLYFNVNERWLAPISTEDGRRKEEDTLEILKEFRDSPPISYFHHFLPFYLNCSAIDKESSLVEATQQRMKQRNKLRGSTSMIFHPGEHGFRISRGNCGCTGGIVEEGGKDEAVNQWKTICQTFRAHPTLEWQLFTFRFPWTFVRTLEILRSLNKKKKRRGRGEGEGK